MVCQSEFSVYILKSSTAHWPRTAPIWCSSFDVTVQVHCGEARYVHGGLPRLTSFPQTWRSSEESPVYGVDGRGVVGDERRKGLWVKESCDASAKLLCPAVLTNRTGETIMRGSRVRVQDETTLSQLCGQSPGKRYRLARCPLVQMWQMLFDCVIDEV